MDQKQGPSLLEYARFHGIATPSITVNPLEYIDQTCETKPSTKSESSATLKDYIPTGKSIERDANSEKLNVSKNDARLLSTVRNMRAECLEVKWDDYLPSIPRMEGLKIELPVLMTHHESDMATLINSVRSSRGSVALSLLQTCPPYSIADCSSSFVNMGSEAEGRARMERLSCSKECFLLIQNARKCGDIDPADINTCLEIDLQAYQHTIREPGPPLIPIDFDELYSPSPSPKPQMLPSPVSSNPIQRHESRICQQKTERFVSIPQQFPHGEDEKFSNVQHQDEEEPSNTERASGLREEEDAKPGKHLPHQPGSSWDLAQDAASANSEIELASAHDPNRPIPFPCISHQASSTYQGTVIDISHPIEAKQGAQNCVKGETSEMRKPTETSHRGYMDKVQVVNSSWYEPRARTGEEHITTNESCYTATFTSGQLNTIEDAAVVDEEYNQQTQVHTVSQRPNRQRKRKAKNEHSLKKQQRRHGKKWTTTKSQADNKVSDLLSPFTALGSLPAFMETRGIIPKRRVNAESPHFAVKHKLNHDQTEPQKPMVDITNTQIEPEMQREERVTVPTNTATPQLIPQHPRKGRDPPLLFLSTSLLKSHLRLTQILETTKDPQPTLIYRDYDKHTTSTNKRTINHDLQNEADIIISPSTGIILTTSQATTQLYLPGHKNAHPHLDGIKGINSPFRERIVLLAPRYERLYVLVCHSGGTAKKKPTVDKRTLASITSLTAFCNSVSGYSTIIPLLVSPSAPETAAQWIMGLASKHSFQLPQFSTELGMPRNIGFTPINPRNDRSRVDPAVLETETRWELFLRRAGLNPFAAQIVLLVLKKEEGNSCSNTAAYNNMGTKTSGLSRFVEMSSETRRRLFTGLIGDRVLKRIEAIMDNDWQCDWALNFDAIQN